MFTNKKIKSTVAAVSAAAAIIINTMTSLAAPYAYNSVDDIRAKALGQYLSANTVVAMTPNKLPLMEKVDIITSSDVVGIYDEVTQQQAVNFNTIKRLNPSLEAGATKTVREGEMGEKTVAYKVKYENGAEVSREVMYEYVTKAPVDKIVEYGNKGTTPDAPINNGLDYKYVIECKATAYDLSAEENGGYAGQSATGVPLDKGVIAVDPRVIPLGSRVYIEALDGSWSYGYAVAADTGGAIKGKRVDLCYRTQYECVQFGVRPCRVYVLS
ncbi:MAG: G5 domain-containing protein [Clostridia bacterium]|nr:G5 domain-containing protein [Clostridia bacterium]